MQRKEWKTIVNKLEKRRKELGYSYEEITEQNIKDLPKEV